MNVAILKKTKNLNLIKESLESSSIHAIPNIVRNKNVFIKSIWFLCFIVSSSICVWFILNSINDFLKFEVTTKIDIVNQLELIFPVISICNLNMFTTNYAKNYSKEIFGTDYQNIDDEKLRVLFKARDDTANRHLLGKKIDDIIINCRFIEKNCNIYEDFEEYFDLNYGNCFRFNSGKNMLDKSFDQKFIKKPGVSGSLNLELFIGSSNQNIYPFSVMNGFNIFITNQSSISSENEGLIIAPGTFTRIMLNKYSIKKHPSPYSECTSDLNSIDSYHSDCYKKLFKSSLRSYKYNNCQRMCFLKYLANECKCQLTFYNMIYDSTLRNCRYFSKNQFSEDLDCINNAWHNVYNNYTVLKECDCPFECENNAYSSTISTAEFPTRYYYNYLMMNNSFINQKYSNLSYEQMKQSIAKVQIFYDELKQTVISQEIKTSLPDLISNIGGILGLFLGMSFLSLIEFIEIFFYAFKIFFQAFSCAKIENLNN